MENLSVMKNNFSLKPQTEIQTNFSVFFVLSEKTCLVQFFFSFIPPICVCFSVNSSNCHNQK